MHSAVTPARLSLVRLEGLTRQLASTVSLAGFQTTPNNKPFAPSFAGSAPAATSSTSTIAAKTDVRMRARGRALQELLDRRDEERAEEEDAIPAVTQLEFTTPLDIVKYPDPRLRAPNAPVGCFDESLRKLSEAMFEVMYQDDGVGLAAPQVGVNVRLMVFNETGKPDRNEVVLVNPRIISSSSDKKVFEEGCLSFPGIYGDVIRPSKVRVSAQDLTGKRFTINISGFPARVFQHEYDHLQAVLYCDRMVPEAMKENRAKFVEMEEAFLKNNPSTEIRRVK